jgi:hypothetical protein
MPVNSAFEDSQYAADVYKLWLDDYPFLSSLLQNNSQWGTPYKQTKMDSIHTL